MSFKEEEIHQQFGWKPLGTHVLTLISEKTDSSQNQCSRCLAIHIARPLKNGGALPIFHANPSYFDDSEIQSSDFQ